MSDLDKTTEICVLEAKVKALTKALVEAKVEAYDNGEAAIDVASELEALRVGVRGFAVTLRSWAVAAGGHAPSAIVASKLLELIGDEVPAATAIEGFNADGSPAQ